MAKRNAHLFVEGFRQSYLLVNVILLWMGWKLHSYRRQRMSAAAEQFSWKLVSNSMCYGLCDR
jgi:hypothetical protein